MPTEPTNRMDDLLVKIAEDIPRLKAGVFDLDVRLSRVERAVTGTLETAAEIRESTNHIRTMVTAIARQVLPDPPG